jgi:hypothetical protein
MIVIMQQAVLKQGLNQTTLFENSIEGKARQ